jgi:hypothetical protein
MSDVVKTLVNAQIIRGVGCGWRCSYGFILQASFVQSYLLYIYIYIHPSTLAASTLIILFSEMLRFSPKKILNNKKEFVKMQNIESLRKLYLLK